ncbi:PstS family phosphate ABC transporter substrate-binding protein [Edaphobacter bradus]|uniref:PstS family phosphate ABC transporter substrate-binding protein n=1 Tax=Edaphobacter bradus TaxID=2259016 RepID=UPI0021DFD5A6|nr:substrate-binding domain-containing protein [Edaphobacter bradus]
MIPERRSAVTLRLAAAVVVCGFALHANTQEQQRNGLDVQKARAEHVAGRAKKAYYTRKFDLSGLPEYQPEQQVSGNIRIWGSNYFQDSNLNDYWVAGFHKYQPNVTFSFNMLTALESAAALATGVADMAACRLFTFQETEMYQRVYNKDPLRITIATGSFDVPGWSPALAVMVNKENPIAKLSLKQLDGIFGAARTGGWEGTTWHPEKGRPASENIRTWGQLGLTGKWKNAPIHVYGLNLKYGMANDFQEIVMKGGDKWTESLTEYANYARPDGTLQIAADELMKDLSKDPYGIAYSGAMFLTPQTKALAISEKDNGPWVDLTIDNVRNRTYPLLLEVYYYLNCENGKPVDPKEKEFLRYTLSREGQEAIERDGKYLPLTAEEVRAQLKKLE